MLCQRMLMTPWALTTFAAAAADAATAVTFKKLRRVGRARCDDFVVAFLSLECSAATLALPFYFYKMFMFHLAAIQLPPPDNRNDCTLVCSPHAVAACSAFAALAGIFFGTSAAIVG
jgi:hypothetical protein